MKDMLKDLRAPKAAKAVEKGKFQKFAKRPYFYLAKARYSTHFFS